MLLVLFYIVNKGPGVTWIAHLGLKRHSKWSLGCAGLFGPFVTSAIHSHRELRSWNSKRKYGKWIVMLKKNIMAPMAPTFLELSYLTDSVEQAKLDIIYCCQLYCLTSSEPKIFCTSEVISLSFKNRKRLAGIS